MYILEEEACHCVGPYTNMLGHFLDASATSDWSSSRKQNLLSGRSPKPYASDSENIARRMQYGDTQCPKTHKTQSMVTYSHKHIPEQVAAQFDY